VKIDFFAGPFTVKIEHPLHRAIGDFLRQLEFPSSCQPLWAQECGGQQNIPLFCSEEKGNHTEFCDVDFLVSQNQKVKLILEIEESDLSPTQVCGKFLTSALSTRFIHKVFGDKRLPMDEEVTFIQILDSTKLQPNTAKLKQGIELQRAIQEAIEFRWTKIRSYHSIFFHGVADFQKRRQELKVIVESVLGTTWTL